MWLPDMPDVSTMLRAQEIPTTLASKYPFPNKAELIAKQKSRFSLL